MTGPDESALLDTNDAASLEALDASYHPYPDVDQWQSADVDHALWNRRIQQFEGITASLSAEHVSEALTAAMRAAAVDTGAIEGLYETTRGLTFSIAVQEAAWQQKMRAQSEELADYFAAQMRAYELAATIANGAEPITEAWIRQLHEVVMAPVATYRARTPQGWAEVPLVKGRYKQLPNHVQTADGTFHSYAPVHMTGPEMHRLVASSNSELFNKLHPVVQSAFTHYSFVAVHPFADGNGRVARALASVFLRRACRVPLMIWVDQRPEYFDALEKADAGDLQVFVDFVFDRALEAIGFVSFQLGPRPSALLAGLASLHRTHGGLTFTELDALATQVMRRTVELGQALLSHLTLPPGTTATCVFGGPGTTTKDPDYRAPVQGQAIGQLHFQSSAPANAQVVYELRCVITRRERARYAFRLECEQVAGDVDIRLRDVHPEFVPSLIGQAEAWMERLIGLGLSQLATAAESSLRSAGY